MSEPTTEQHTTTATATASVRRFPPVHMLLRSLAATICCRCDCRQASWKSGSGNSSAGATRGWSDEMDQQAECEPVNYRFEADSDFRGPCEPAARLHLDIARKLPLRVSAHSWHGECEWEAPPRSGRSLDGQHKQMRRVAW